MDENEAYLRAVHPLQTRAGSRFRGLCDILTECEHLRRGYMRATGWPKFRSLPEQRETVAQIIRTLFTVYEENCDLRIEIARLRALEDKPLGGVLG